MTRPTAALFRSAASGLLAACVIPAGCASTQERASTETAEAAAAPIAEPVALPAHVAGDWAGRIVVVDFWATWCRPCTASAPNVQILHDEFAADSDILVVGVHVDDNVEDPRAHHAAQGHTYPIVERGGDVSDVFDVYGLPTFVVLDREGREVYRHIGMMNEKTRRSIADKVRSLRG